MALLTSDDKARLRALLTIVTEGWPEECDRIEITFFSNGYQHRKGVEIGIQSDGVLYLRSCFSTTEF